MNGGLAALLQLSLPHFKGLDLTAVVRDAGQMFWSRLSARFVHHVYMFTAVSLDGL